MSKIDQGSESWYTRNRLILLFSSPLIILLLIFIFTAFVLKPNIEGDYEVLSINGDDNQLLRTNLTGCEKAEMSIKKEIATIKCGDTDKLAMTLKDGKISAAMGAEVNGDYSVSGDTIQLKVDGVAIETKKKKQN